jgi:hypothetical protein
MLGGPHHHPGMPPMHPSHHMGGPPPSYTYGHPPRMMEEKTILRKKFSWKHYPEVRAIITLYCCLHQNELNRLDKNDISSPFCFYFLIYNLVGTVPYCQS